MSSAIRQVGKQFLQSLGHVPGCRAGWLGLARWALLHRRLSPWWRDFVMWDMATQILGPEYEVTVPLATGPRLITGMEDNVTRTVLFYGAAPYFIWEPQTLALALQLLGPAGAAIIAGGHIGYHALHLALASTSRVIAFEPVGKFSSRLLQSAALSGASQLTVVHAALDSQKSEHVLFHVAGAWSSLDASIAGNPLARERVNCVTLDEYLMDQPVDQVNLIWLDVEGAELRVLMGAERILESGPDLILEVNPPALSRQGLSAADMYNYLFGRGYAVYGIVDAYSGVHRRPEPTVPLRPITPDLPHFSAQTKWFNVWATRHTGRLSQFRVATVK